MKKVLTFCFLLFLTVSLISFYSCEKPGCIDPDSINYDPDATTDDGSCQYEGNAVIWYGSATAQELINDGATSLFYYVDGQLVGSTAASFYFTAAPNCGQSGTITITKSLGFSKTLNFPFSVKDQTGFEYWNGTLTFNANDCFKMELTW